MAPRPPLPPQGREEASDSDSHSHSEEAAAGRGTPGAAWTVVARLRGALGLATLLMFGLSWPLWVEPSRFPRVPFAPAIPPANALVAWVLFALLMGTIVAATLGLAWRAALGASGFLIVLLFLGDQHRFQAWTYQFAMVAVLLAALPGPRALRLVRWWFIATYAYSGLSKLDSSFCRELGATMLATVCGLVGLDPHHWPALLRTAAILAMPGGELLVALMLSVPATRRPGRLGAILLHLALVLILGPWGMGHSAIVLVWNAAMALEVGIAFGPEATASRPESGPGSAPGRGPACVWGWLASAAFAIGVLLPLGEPWGYCGAWPAHALYASHVARTDVYLLESELGGYAPEIQAHARAVGPGPWCRLDLTGWSRAVRGVPVYPQARACNGVAEALAACYGERRAIRVVQWGRADRWTGTRSRAVLMGRDEIRRYGETFLLNAHPAPAFQPPVPHSPAEPPAEPPPPATAGP